MEIFSIFRIYGLKHPHGLGEHHGHSQNGISNYVCSHLADDVTSFYITRHDHYVNPKSKSHHPSANVNPEILGPKVILYDFWRSQGWDILTHGGFVTYIHHDASGLATYVYPRSGAKIWGFVHVKTDISPKTRPELFTMFDNMLDESQKDLGDTAVMGTVLIEEGDIL